MRTLLKPIRLLTVALPMIVIATVAFKAGEVWQQPHMRAALEALQGAKHHLDAAADDKGGHRAKAIILVHDAIAEVQAGIEYARTH
ncbi:MAG TPA: hypothetical protein VI159_08440 [Gemmatimonadales bacterium]